MAELTLAEKLKRLDSLSKGINEKAKKTVMGRLSISTELQEKLEIDYIETPSLNVNTAIGGGFPRRKTTIIAGKEDSGKTGILLETIGKMQAKDPNFVAGWLESENSLSEKHFTMFNIDKTRFVLLEHEREGAGEAALDQVEAIMATGAIDMMCINSLKCLVPKEEIKKSLADAVVGTQARMNARMMRKYTSLVSEHNTAFIIVTHLTTDIGSSSKDPLIVAGGSAILYGASIILDFRKRAILDGDPVKKEEAIKFAVAVRKNHCVPDKFPYVRTEYYAMLGIGIEQHLEVLQSAVEQGILIQAGAFIKFPDDKGEPLVHETYGKLQWQGRAEYKKFMVEHPEFFEQIKAMTGGNVVKMSDEEVDNILAEENALEALLGEEVVAETKLTKKKKK